MAEGFWEKIHRQAQEQLGEQQPTEGEVPLDPRLSAYLNQYSPQAPRNGLIELMGLPENWKMTRKDLAEYEKNLPMQMGMGTMGTLKPTGQFGKVLMQEAPAANLGKVIMKEAAPENLGKVIMKEPKDFTKLLELLNRKPSGS